MGNLESPVNLIPDACLLKVRGSEVPGVNPCRHRENKQTPHRKGPGLESNKGPSCCELTQIIMHPQVYMYVSMLL